jgi:hypothetical protein
MFTGWKNCLEHLGRYQHNRCECAPQCCDDDDDDDDDDVNRKKFPLLVFLFLLLLLPPRGNLLRLMLRYS